MAVQRRAIKKLTVGEEAVIEAPHPSPAEARKVAAVVIMRPKMKETHFSRDDLAEPPPPSPAWDCPLTVLAPLPPRRRRSTRKRALPPKERKEAEVAVLQLLLPPP